MAEKERAGIHYRYWVEYGPHMSQYFETEKDMDEWIKQEKRWPTHRYVQVYRNGIMTEAFSK